MPDKFYFVVNPSDGFFLGNEGWTKDILLAIKFNFFEEAQEEADKVAGVVADAKIKKG